MYNYIKHKLGDKKDKKKKEEKKKVPPRPLVAQKSLTVLNESRTEVVAEKIEDVYTFGRELGSGAFSTVRLGTHNASGEQFAIKIIDKKNVKQDLHRLAIEMDVLKSVCHPNIIELKEIFETDETLYIVTEVVSGGELFDRIVEKGSYSEKDAAMLIRKLIEALDYLHDKNIVHRDLKPENLLLKSKNEDTEVKLADFGLSKVLGNEVLMQTACGTPGYVAPEILKAEGYGKGVDLWSVGVITYILLCGFPPFYNENVPALFESIINAEFDYPDEYWSHISDDAIDFIDNLLVADPSKRMDAKAALQHTWLQGNAPSTPLKAVQTKLKEYNVALKESKTSMNSENPLGL